MAIEAQGVQVRRQSTAAGSTGQTVAATLVFSATGISRSDAGDFTADGFSTGMRVETDSTANSTRIFTLSSVAATAMAFYETAVVQSSGISFTVTGHDFEAIGEVVGFNGPSGSANVIDVTHLGSTAKEKRIGLRDEGQVSLDIIYDSNATALHTALRDDRASRTKRIYDIKLTDNGTASSQPSALYFNSYVTAFSITGAVDDVIKGALTLEITSAVLYIDAV